MLDEHIVTQLHAWAKAALSIRSALALGTHSLTPLNYEQEKENFLSSKTYNPHFIYHKKVLPGFDERLYQLHQELLALNIPKDLKSYLIDYLDDLKVLELTNKYVGTENFSHFAEELFGLKLPTEEELLAQLPPFSFEKNIPKELYKASQISDEFEKILFTRYQLTDFTVRLDDFNAITIRVSKSRVIIGSKVKRNLLNVLRLIVHEIESHALQSYNLYSLRNPLLQLTTFNESLLFGEGLAVYNEYQTQTLTQKAHDTYYYRLQAVGMIDKSFREIYEYLTPFMPMHQAFIITYRVKRGLANTAKPGGFPKDAAYLLGFLKVKHYVDSGGDIRFLYLSKVPQWGVLLQKYRLLDPQAADQIILPEFLTTKKHRHPSILNADLHITSHL